MKYRITAWFSVVCLFISCTGMPTDDSLNVAVPGNILEHPVFIGASLGFGAPDADKIAIFEKQSGKDISMAVWFLGWDQPFPLEVCSDLYSAGIIPHITWEPHYWFSDEKITLVDIINGDHDDYILAWAEGIKKYGNPLFIRLMHEFNGNWYDWGIANNNEDPSRYICAWRHIHDLLSENGVKNVKYIWTPGQNSFPDEPWNNPILSYPGDEYVDWLGIDGYNWGTYYEWSSWTEFEQIFMPMYNLLSKKIPDKPIMIPEFSCFNHGGNRAEWIRHLPKQLNKFPNIKAIAWFDVIKEEDLRVAATRESALAWKQILNEENFKSNYKKLWVVE
ncbi:MAG: hypothetical protein JXB03_09240 [Spirochaetales bacterium]|nr:hypothetical protein [Spirochaetales bacterium]